MDDQQSLNKLKPMETKSKKNKTKQNKIIGKKFNDLMTSNEGGFKSVNNWAFTLFKAYEYEMRMVDRTSKGS